VTVDHRTLDDETVTVRERDSTEQIRVPIAEVTALLKALCELEDTWEAAQGRYPAQAVAEDADGDVTAAA